MTVKQFFKSTTFKCIIALLSILLVSGIFLTIMYGLLQVTEGEKLQRAVGKIYDVTVATPEIYGKDDSKITAEETDPKGLIEKSVVYDNAEILQMYKIVYGSDTDFLVLSKGSGGYGGGSVTCWVAVNVNIQTHNIVKVRKVSVSENVGQSFIGNITDTFLKSFTGEDNYRDHYSTSDGFLTAGASMSSNAICNAVNGATNHIKTAVFGVTASVPYEGFDYIKMIDLSDPYSYFEKSGSDVVFHIVTKTTDYTDKFKLDITVDAQKAVKSFTIVSNGSTKKGKTDYAETMKPASEYVGWKKENFLAALNADQSKTEGEIYSGASYSNYVCIYAGLFATANYDKCAGGNN